MSPSWRGVSLPSMQTYAHPVTIYTTVDTNANVSARSEHVSMPSYHIAGNGNKMETMISQQQMYI